jgi:hypothetical protein
MSQIVSPIKQVLHIFSQLRKLGQTKKYHQKGYESKRGLLGGGVRKKRKGEREDGG